jgi:hypothetical protein
MESDHGSYWWGKEASSGFAGDEKISDTFAENSAPTVQSVVSAYIELQLPELRIWIEKQRDPIVTGTASREENHCSFTLL